MKSDTVHIPRMSSEMPIALMLHDYQTAFCSQKFMMDIYNSFCCGDKTSLVSLTAISKEDSQ